MKEKSMLDEEEDDDQDIQQVPAPLLVSFATGIGVIFILILIWIASRWKTTCLRSVQNRPQDPVDSVCHAVSSSAIFPSPTTAPSSARRQQRSLWTWINPPNDRPSAHQLDDDSLPAYDRQLDRDPSTGEQDRMALIAYMSDSNTSSQVSDLNPDEISSNRWWCLCSFLWLADAHTPTHTPYCVRACRVAGRRTGKRAGLQHSSICWADD